VRLRRGRADELQFAIGWPDAAHRKQGRRCAARDRRTRCAVVLVPSGDAKVGLTTQADFIVSLAPVCRGRGAFEAAVRLCERRVVSLRPRPRDRRRVSQPRRGPRPRQNTESR
jgi:hypothetical protein